MNNAKFLLVLACFICFSQSGFSQKRTVIYVQNASALGPIQWTKMTHLVHAFFNPTSTASGVLTTGAGVPTGAPAASIWFTTANFTNMRTAALAANPNIKISISAGGAPTASDPNITTRFNTLLADPTRRTELVNSYALFIQNYNLDGFDFDLEHPVSTIEKDNHQLFLQEMKTRLNALEATMCKQLEISIALNAETDHFVVSPAGSDYVNATVDPFVDIYHLMAYDASYSTHNAINSAWPLNHSPLIHAQEAVRDFSSAPFNWAKNKMCVGIAFYGKTGFNGGGGTSLYSAINASNSAVLYANDTDGTYGYNGCNTITNKVNFAFTEGLAGVVVWEGSQDRTGTNSLQSCIYTAMTAQSNLLIETSCCAQPALGNDKVVCNTGFPITLNSSTSTAGTAVNYTWTKLPATAIASGAGLNTQSITAGNGAGTYVVVRTETVGGRTCTQSDTIVITSTLPIPNLGPDKTLCGSNYNLSPSNISAFPVGTTWQWQYAGSNIVGATTSSFYASTPGTYTLVATLGGCTNTSDDVIISASTVTPVDACRTTAGTLTLSVTGGVGPFNWYNQDSPGGTLLGTGSSFVTPSLPLPSVTDYFVEAVGSATNYSIGIPSSAAPTGFANNTPTLPSVIAMEFDVTSQIKIRSVDVYAWGGGTYPTTFNIQIYNDNNAVVYTSSNITWAVWPGASWQTITLDASLPVGKYRMRANNVSGGAAAFFHQTASTFPYTGGAGKISITRQIGVAQYGPFYNWQISDFGNCNRVRVRATVAASCSGPLPVDLLSFTATKIDKDALLEWSTTKEVNSAYYSAERSLNGVDYYSIATVQSTGNSKSRVDYSYYDQQIPSGKVYYRLAQYDNDGTITYSHVAVVDNTKGIELFVAPNPFADYTTITLTGNTSHIDVKIYNLEGSLVASTYYSTSHESIKVGQGLASGLYILQVSNNEFLETYKIVKE